MKCSVLKVKFEDPDSGYCVVQYKMEELKKTKSGTPLEQFTAVGYGLPIADGCTYDLRGNWAYSKRYKEYQLQVTAYQEVLPTTEDGIIAYLQSGVISHVGPKTAKLIVEKFGIETFRIFDEEPERLMEIKGISENRYQKLIQSYRDHIGARDVIAYLASYKITANKAIKVYRYFGENTVTVLRETPYRLCEISGFGFLTVDVMARQIGIAYDDPMRIAAGVRHVLEEALQKGNLFLDSDTVLSKSIRLLGDAVTGEEPSRTAILSAVQNAVQNGDMVLEGQNIYLRPAFDAECGVAECLEQLRHNNCRKIGKLEERITEAEQNQGITLSDQQKAAVKTCFENPVTIITGDPGTGKTTIQKVLLSIFSQATKGMGETLLCAPTGRAARRMMESSDHDSKTIHMALMHMGDGTGSTQFTEELIIVDEMSMVDIYLAWDLLKAISNHTRLVLIGDANQLPPVGPGKVLSDLIQSAAVPVIALKEIYRQAEGSRIIGNAALISAGNHALQYGDDFQFVNADDAGQAVEFLKQLYVTELAQHPLDEVQILSPVRKNGDLGIRQLNPVLRDMINPSAYGKKELQIGSRVFRAGDKVMQTANAQDIANGDIGYIKDIHTGPETGAKLAVIDFGMERVYEYSREELENVELAYASTIHKSQGSEFSVVIVPVLMEHAFMLCRNLIYTAITRAKTKVILIGMTKALHMAIGKNDSDQRNTILTERIKETLKVKDNEAQKGEAAESAA